MIKLKHSLNVYFKQEVNFAILHKLQLRYVFVVSLLTTSLLFNCFVLTITVSIFCFKHRLLHLLLFEVRYRFKQALATLLKLLSYQNSLSLRNKNEFVIKKRKLNKASLLKNTTARL